MEQLFAGCCYIDPETKKGCESEAEWMIVTGHSPDDQVDSCTAHVGYLLVDKPFIHVFLLKGAE